MKSRKKKTAAKSRAADDEVATIKLSGEALRRATAYGDGDPSKGADLILCGVVDVWVGEEGEVFEYQGPAWTDRDPGETNTIASGLGVKAEIDISVTNKMMDKVVADQLCEMIRGAGYTEIPTSEITDLSALSASCIVARLHEFREIVGSKFRRDLLDTFGDVLAAVLSDVFDRWNGNARFSIEQRRQLVQKIKNPIKRMKNADETFRVRPFSRMRGGVSEATLLDPPTLEQLAAYGAFVGRLTPVWKTITAMRNHDPHGWTPDANDLAVKKFTDAEVVAYREIVGRIPNNVHSLNGARIAPAVCAREHARIILGITERSDKQLQAIARIQTTDP